MEFPIKFEIWNTMESKEEGNKVPHHPPLGTNQSGALNTHHLQELSEFSINCYYYKYIYIFYNVCGSTKLDLSINYKTL